MTVSNVLGWNVETYLPNCDLCPPFGAAALFLWNIYLFYKLYSPKLCTFGYFFE